MKILIQAGKLYLTAHDAIALSLENNIDIENARYSPILTEWNLERALAGGALPGVPSGATQSASVASGQGVLGSQQAAGVSLPGLRGGSSGTTNAQVTQVGPVTPVLDPSIQESTTFGHRSNPQANTILSKTNNLAQGVRTYSGSYTEGFLTGGSVTISYSDHYLNENSPQDVLNPSVAPALSFSIQQNLLQGLGIPVNARNITVAKLNVQMSDLNFKTQVSGNVVNVLNNYYSLVADYDDMRAKQDALDTAQKFFDESRRRLELGALSQLDITTAENQVATSRLALVNSQAALKQQELQLKNLISRDGPGNALIADVDIVPVDHLAIPASDDIPPIKELVQRALANRSDLVVERSNLRGTEISNLGTLNGLLPLGPGILASPQHPRVSPGRQRSSPPSFRRAHRRTRRIRIFRAVLAKRWDRSSGRTSPLRALACSARFRSTTCAAQADYGDRSTRRLRQQQLITAKDMNQAQVDITNSVVALRQARARYDAAVQSKLLQQALLDAEEKKFTFGASTPYNVVVEQRDLAAARSSELAALVTWQSARISLDQNTGSTLEVNHISLTEVEKGKLAEASVLPAVPAAGK